MPDTVAVIDVGSNSIKLLVARAGAKSNSIDTLCRETIETRISGGISSKLPSLNEDAITAGTNTIAKLQNMAQNYQPDRTVVVATSAVRDAINGNDFVQNIAEGTGLQVRILSGAEEANYIGQGISCDPAIGGMTSFIQTDIGGGSLELIRFEAGQIQQAISLQLGAVRLTERFVEDADAPLTLKIEASIRRYVTEQLMSSDFDFSPAELPLIGTGGAYTVSRAMLAAETDSDIEHSLPHLERSTLSQLKNKLAPLPVRERLSIPHLPAAREVANRSSLTHSLYNLRYGVAANLLKQQTKWRL